jgi:hypothetical protein
MNEARSPMGMNPFHVRLVVGEGYQTLPDTALPCPYMVLPNRGEVND